MAERYITQRSQSGKLLTTCNIQIGQKILQISRDKLNLHGLKRPLSHIPILEINWKEKLLFSPLKTEFQLWLRCHQSPRWVVCYHHWSRFDDGGWFSIQLIATNDVKIRQEQQHGSLVAESYLDVQVELNF